MELPNLSGVISVDPITLGIFGAFTAFNNFLCTPAGQKFALDAEQIITSILGKFDVHLAANLPKTS